MLRVCAVQLVPMIMIMWYYDRVSKVHTSADARTELKEGVFMLPENPDMLASFINTQLRDNFSSLEDFCEAFDADKEEIIVKLKKADYRYDEERHCFK